ncbi:LicD family protein [Loktanella atrilutea]|uniref:LicD family protein n=1 Tax=Loktanella atrilutea TaxID=366533 RepID=A0A1M5ELT4_LOKAT|nr:LicD family protein [Loktanella atrilutea]SHF80189.1 LicD family protein [Loktanella atrilutea]
MDTRRFDTLHALRGPHGRLSRIAMAGLAGLAVAALTGHADLAREVAGLFRQDRWVTGSHRLNWYLRHSTIGRLAGLQAPLFDPVTGMPPATVDALQGWLGKGCDPRDRLARLNVLAHRIVTAPDATTQATAIAAFEDVAAPLVHDMPVADLEAAAAPAGPAPAFGLSEARAALIALRQIRMPWYVISGTFLGAVREGTFLAHDYDIDIGIHAEDFDDAAFRAQIGTTKDLVLVNTSPHRDLALQPDGLWRDTPRPALYRLLHASGIGVDVFVHHPDGDLRWHGSAKHRWDNHDFALADYTIAGLPVRGPADADRYLTENYGDWRTPVTRFNCSTGTPNVRFPFNPAALVEHLRIALRPHPAREAQIARLVLWQEGHLHHRGAEGTRLAVVPQGAGQTADRDCPAPTDPGR